MSRTLSIPAQDHGQAYLFALNIIEADAKDLIEKPNAPEKLLGVALNPDFAEIIRISDLDDLGLIGYLEQGYEIPEQNLRADKRKLSAVEGFVLIVLSRAFDAKAHTIAIGPELTHLGRYSTTPTDWEETSDMHSESAAPYSAPEETIKERPSDGAMMGRVATIVLLVLFALTGLMVWIAG
ncbi:MAG: hypothetical protein ABJD13_16835 [Paracoccaceae bacterium]